MGLVAFLGLPQNSLQVGRECGLDGGREKAILGAVRPGLSCYPGCVARSAEQSPRGLVQGKEVSSVIGRQGAQPQSSAHSQTAWEAQADGTGRTTGAHSKEKRGEGLTNGVQGRHQEVLAQTRPSASKVVWPVRTRHQSTRKRRAIGDEDLFAT
jgi:hypothetical protein